MSRVVALDDGRCPRCDRVLDESAAPSEPEDVNPYAAGNAPTTDTAPPLSAAEEAGVLQEIRTLENARPGWSRAIFVLLISLLLFLGLAGTAWDWQFTMMLIPILLFHEMGHAVAMRMFGYHDVRMFFIPLFGAAVSGRHYNVVGWKRAVVSLAGPLPGIALGIALGMTAIALRQKDMMDWALLLLVLNGFNLLPIMPLDGGATVHGVLFCRHPWLDAGFRLLAAVAMVLIGLALQAWLLLALGAFMLLGTPIQFKIARSVADLRKSPMMSAPIDDHEIPTTAALAIIAELRKVLVGIKDDKVIAKNTINIYQTINTHPPGILASLAILGVHAVSFAASLVFVVVFQIALQQF